VIATVEHWQKNKSVLQSEQVLQPKMKRMEQVHSWRGRGGRLSCPINTSEGPLFSLLPVVSVGWAFLVRVFHYNSSRLLAVKERALTSCVLAALRGNLLAIFNYFVRKNF